MSECNNVLVLGSGAREHAIAWKLEQSELVNRVYVAPGNACKYSVAQEIPHLNDIDLVRQFCTSYSITLVVIGPEQQICEGWANQLEDVCAHVFAPSKQAARLEASKAFAKHFMHSNGLPTAKYGSFNDLQTALDFVNGIDWSKIVVKEDGLCAGKGVSISQNKQEAVCVLNTLFNQNQNASVVIEQFLQGFEVSALCFCDGQTIHRMPLSQDHKKALEGDMGENTGGMGAIAPIVVAKQVDEQITHILQKTVTALKEQGTPYKGVLYAGLMITTDGPRLLEFNCRFGDPETEVLLRLLHSDLYQIFMACCIKNLATIETKINWYKKYSIGIVVASKGYPSKLFPTNIPIANIPGDDEHTVTFYAGVKLESGQLLSCGGRVLCVTSLANSPFLAKAMCLKAVESVNFSVKHYRRDIGDFVLLPRSQLNYAKSGVNICEGNAFVEKIQKFCGQTLTPGTKQIGGFGALVDLKREGFQNAQLVIGMDGVGTKIELAQQSGILKGLGFDLVGMCANDVLCHGAKPIAFLDYYVTGKLVKEEAVQLVESISEACLEAGCALVGGETAEMPGVYAPNQWDLAGCCVGARESFQPELPRILEVEVGDLLIGLPSNGLHSNGFSLVRKIMQSSGCSVNDTCPWDENVTLGHSLLQPTRIYVKDLLNLATTGHIKAMAHITGGGILENLPRALPPHLAALIDCSKWPSQPVFSWLRQMGNIEPLEMLRTFNCGLGMVLVVSHAHTTHVQQQLKNFHQIGHVTEYRPGGNRVDFGNLHQLFCQFHFNTSFVHRRRVNVAILISGSGSNMARLIHESRRRNSYCHVNVVISNKPGVLGLEVARELGVESIVIPHGSSRPDFERKVTKELEERGVELICLAGFMRVLTAEFVNRWTHRVINIHPSLLPSFKGAKAVPLALEAGVKITGCTVHFVEEDIDAGKILGQESVVIEPQDDEESLHKKIQTKEYLLFPKVMQEVARKMVE